MRREILRLTKMVNALINRAERSASSQGSDFGMFQTAVTLEALVKNRTAALEDALRENEKINRALQNAKEQLEAEIEERQRVLLALEQEKEEQRVLIRKLEEAHLQLLQSEKLAAIGQLAAGVAHEINNPIGFVKSNLGTLQHYAEDLLSLIQLYEDNTQETLHSVGAGPIIEARRQEIDFSFVRSDIGSLIQESIEGTSRVHRIVLDLRDFSRLDSGDWQFTDLHAGLESTLNVVANEIRYKAEVVCEFGQLPLVECLPSQLNQVFMNILVNAAQAIKERGIITLRTGTVDDQVWISITDTGEGIPPELCQRVFDPFFTTKPVGKGTGLGLSVSYGIIKKHGGRIDLESQPGKGSCFTICLPVKRQQTV